NSAGAYTEALRNYYEPSNAAALIQRGGRLQILDACYGLGYNSLVLLTELIRADVGGTIDITAIERDPEILKYAPQVLSHDYFTPLRQSLPPLHLDRFGNHQATVGKLQINLRIVESDLRRIIPDI